MHKECIMDKGNSTSECSSRSSLRDRIIDVALDDFTSQGIRSVTMDEVATKLGISKRTLYEVFADKEALLVDCILKLQGNADAYVDFVSDVLQHLPDNLRSTLVKMGLPRHSQHLIHQRAPSRDTESLFGERSLSQ